MLTPHFLRQWVLPLRHPMRPRAAAAYRASFAPGAWGPRLRVTHCQAWKRALTTCGGFNLVEIIAASVIGALLAGGTMTAFVMSMKTSQQSLGTAQATQLAQQTLERFRDKISCEDGQWYSDSCAPTLPSGVVDDDLPPGSALSTFGGSRNYAVTKEDCDGDGTPGDCLKVVSTVTWTPPE